MSDMRIKAIKNGPLEVSGLPELTDSAGVRRPVDEDPVYLCRCGQSANKPFCDGSHKRVGFQG